MVDKVVGVLGRLTRQPQQMVLEAGLVVVDTAMPADMALVVMVVLV
jgi:hypothetical protein